MRKTLTKRNSPLREKNSAILKLYFKVWDIFTTMEVIAYLIVGVMTTVINWITYALYLKAAGGSDGASMIKIIAWEFNSVIFAANAVAWVVAVVFAYVTNRYLVFSTRAHGFGGVFAEFWKFIGARVATGIIEIGAPTLLFAIGLDMALFGIDGFVAKVIVSVVVIVLNYVFSKLFVFKGDKKKEKE